MSETGQRNAALWQTLPSERQRTVLLMFAQIIDDAFETPL